MGLNVKSFQLRLWRVIQISIEYSYTFIQKHPLFASALVVLFSLYIFLSYIYSFMVYLSPFLLCIAVFVRIFWSSEQTHLKYAKIEEKKGEKIPKYGRREPIVERKRYLSQHAMSRRRNFKVNKWDVHGGVEEKEKASSTAYSNDIANILSGMSMENNEANSFEKGQSSSAFEPSEENNKTVDNSTSTLRSEPSMIDLVQNFNSLDEQNSKFDGVGGSELETENLEDQDDEDEEETQEDRDKAVEWTEDDQKNLMDLGFSEIERNRRLESLIARRRARKLLKLQIEKGLIDVTNVTPSQIAPLFITRTNPFYSPKESEDLDGLEMPGSAPSLLRPSRNPFDLPYDPSEEKPNLTGDSFHEEFTLGFQKDMPFCRHESFKHDQGDRDSYAFLFSKRKASDRLGYPRFKKLSEKGNQDWLIEKLFKKEGNKGESAAKVHNPIREKSETDRIDTKGDGVENASARKSRLDYRSDSELMKNNNYVFPEDGQEISNIERVVASKKLESRIRIPHHRFPKFPISKRTAIDDSLLESIPSPVDKTHENMFFAERRLCHTPSFSIASDLQVEVSELGSPTLTNDGTNTTTDGESVLYDGDNEKDITSGSEDMWGASFHSRRTQRNNEDMAEECVEEVDKGLKDHDSPILNLQHIDEENSADVSSMSSGSDIADETPTHATNYGHNIFCNMKEAMVKAKPTQPLDFLNASSSQTQLMYSSVDTPPQEPNLAKSEERSSNLSINLTNEAQEVSDVNDSTSIDENVRGNEDPSALTSVNDSTSIDENVRGNEDPSVLTLRQDLVDIVSLNSASSSSPRSVLPEKTSIDEVPPFGSAPPLHIEDIGTNVEDMTQTTSNDGLPLDTLPNDRQQLMDHPTIQLHNDGTSNSQELADPPANSIEEETFGHANDTIAYNKEDREKIKSKQNNEEKSTTQIRKDVELESPKIITSEDIDEKSSEVTINKAKLEPSRRNEETDISIGMEGIKTFGLVNRDEVAIKKPNHFEVVEEDIEAKKDILGNSTTYGVIDSEKLPEVPFNCLTSESPSAQEQKEDKSQTSSSNEDTKEKYDEVNKNESINPLLTTREVEEHIKIGYTVDPRELAQLEDVKTTEQDIPNDSLEEERSFHDSKEFVKDQMGEEKPATSDITKDLQNPIPTDSSSLEANIETIDKVINKDIEQELDKNNTTHQEEIVELLHLQNVKVPNLVEPNDSSQEVGFLRSESNDLIEKDMDKD